MCEIESVDWHILENAKAHHTDRYEVVHEESTPVLRRAQPFKISISFKNRPFNETTDRVRLFFTYGKQKLTPRLQSVIENTTVTSSNRITDSNDQWSLQLLSQNKNTITILVKGPATAAWGLWKLMIKSGLKTSPKTQIWKCPKAFYLIYNPWSKDDDVYMPDTRYLDEYILNDVGKVYTSSSKKPIGMHWIFGQFASSVIKVITKLLDEREHDERPLGAPVYLCHALARSIGEITEGNWSNDYSGGTAPWLWTGSIPIYEEFLKTGIPVKYAQCFIYSGIYTTALRAVGIPARSVTNFISATGGYNMAVNNVFDEKGNTIESASIWNFHVWNDAWMARYDLPPGYGGWQATDATGSVGPASVEAVKKGQVSLSYDVREVTGEINSDRVRWTLDEDDEYHLISVDTKYIGRALLTKQPFIYDPHGDTDFEDVVSLYKEPEGSTEERMALYNAIKQCKDEDEKDDWRYGSLPYHVDIPTNDDDVDFEIEEIDSIIFGQTLNASVRIENSGETAVTVECCLGATAMYYIGSISGLIKREKKVVVVKPSSSETITVSMSPEEYASKLVEFSNVKIHAIATVKENKITWANDCQVIIDMPEINITVKNELELNKEGVILFQLKNILSSKLTKGYLTFEAPGIARNVKVPIKDIKPGENATIEYKVKPTKTGEIPIKAMFTSKELNFMCGSSYLQVM